VADNPGSIKAMAPCGACGHFASVHHGGGGGRPGGSSCAAPDCDCPKFVEGSDARVPLGHNNLTASEVAQLTGLSVHTLSYWRQSGQGPKTIRAGTRTLYRRRDVEHWLAEVDDRTNSPPVGSTGWYAKAVEAAGRIEPDHVSPWKLASTYALLSIAESLLLGQRPKQQPANRAAAPGTLDGELLTVSEVAAMTRLSEGTLRYWRYAGSCGPESIKLGRRVMYRRADVEKWLQEAK
jgi:DNA-binding transcriptional MerR regulator